MRRLGRVIIVAVAAALCVAAFAPPGTAGPHDGEQIFVADAAARAFAVRPSYDTGGAASLNLYIGYTEANLSTPEPQADGQASWYNFGVAETAAFKEPEQCTPEKNAQATLDGASDVQTFATSYGPAYASEVMKAIMNRTVPPAPVVPSIRHGCTKRLPGFTQSRYPSTHSCDAGSCAGIPETASDDLLTKPLCDDPTPACETWKSAAVAKVSDGSYETTATDAPSDQADAATVKLGGPMEAFTIAFASNHSGVRVDRGTVVSEATTTLYDVCIVPVPGGCHVHIDQIRQHASVRRAATGKPVVDAGTVLVGVSGTAIQDTPGPVALDDKTLRLDAIKCCPANGGNELAIEAVSSTRDCTPVQGVAEYGIADAGGLRIFGKGTSGGDTNGGGIMIGGACARARATSTSISFVEPPPVVSIPGTPSRRIVIPGSGLPGPAVAPAALPDRLVRKELVNYVTRRALALRTARVWGSVLSALLICAVAMGLARDTAPVRPLARGVDRFIRRFVRG